MKYQEAGLPPPPHQAPATAAAPGAASEGPGAEDAVGVSRCTQGEDCLAKGPGDRRLVQHIWSDSEGRAGGPGDVYCWACWKNLHARCPLLLWKWAEE